MGVLFEKNKWFWVLFAIVLSLVTFQKTDIHFSRGLDGSYFWAFGYLFSNNSPYLSSSILTYGALGFLKGPVAIGTIPFWQSVFMLIAKSGFIYLILLTCGKLGTRLYIAVTIGILTSLYVFVPEIYLEMICLLLVVNYLSDLKKIWLILAAGVTAFSFYVKCSIGVECCMIQGVFVIACSVNYKKIAWKDLLILSAFTLLFFLGLGLLLLHSIKETIDSLVTYYYCFAGHSETNLLVYKIESPWLLYVSAAAAFAVFFVRSDFTFRLFWCCSFLILYAEWIHSLTRMDRDHYMSFLSYLFFIICLSAAFIRTLDKKAYVLMGISFMAYYANLNNKSDFNEFSLSFPNGLNNAGNAFLYSSERTARAHNESEGGLVYSNLVLPSKVMYFIGKKTVDFFPWDLLFAEANRSLNWKPRPWLQSLNYHAYFDKQTAAYFASAEAPEVLIWHMTGNEKDFFQSYDSRNILIDENFSTKSILCNYRPVFIENGNIIFEKRKVPVALSVKDTLPEKTAGYKEWIAVPDPSKLMMVKTNIKGSFIRTLKKLFYRDEEFQVQFKTREGQVIKKRFSPSDAADGIWINPYILNPADPKSYRRITAIKFLTTGYAGIDPELHLQWQVCRFSEPPLPGADSLGFNGFYRHFSPVK